jgi:hypothetical protein
MSICMIRCIPRMIFDGSRYQKLELKFVDSEYVNTYGTLYSPMYLKSWDDNMDFRELLRHSNCNDMDFTWNLFGNDTTSICKFTLEQLKKKNPGCIDLYYIDNTNKCMSINLVPRDHMKMAWNALIKKGFRS